jgi:hypothetical protein
MVEMTIEDDGSALSDQQAIDVMRPGRRLDESAPGYGFGLPITRELAGLNGGTFALGKIGGRRSESRRVFACGFISSLSGCYLKASAWAAPKPCP